MDILYVLVPLSVVLVLAIACVLAWSVFSGQFDDVERQGERILEDDDRAAPPDDAPLDLDQGAPVKAPDNHARALWERTT